MNRDGIMPGMFKESFTDKLVACIFGQKMEASSSMTYLGNYT